MRKLVMSPAMVAALVIEALLVFVDVAGKHTPQTWEWVTRCETIRFSGEWAASLLFAAGWADLARRASGPTRPLLWLLSLASWTPVASDVAHACTGLAIWDPSRLERIAGYVNGAEMAILVGASVVVTIVARSWRSARLLSLVVVGVPLLMVITTWRVYGFLELGYLAAQAILIERTARDVRDIGPSNTEAAIGFTLVGRAFWVRLVLAVLVGSYGFHPYCVPSITSLAFSITLFVVGWGALRASHSGVTGLRRNRLVIGSALAACWGAFQVHQAFTVWMLDFDISPSEVPFAMVAPLIGLAGFLLVMSAAVGVSSARGDNTLRDQALVFGILIVIGFAVACSDGVPGVHGTSVAVANLIGVVFLPIICSQLGRRFRQAQNVPAARVL